ncbi:DUF4913 domain-containing protein [Streptomyces sp. MB09-01]|uniref:DUF4913 domain-containing protein n=1 Tax=Streptomyces sp. MB09-01 TaxID=3028666 RepID=UPI0029B115F3|nr:DUF4913 domain-containing protein [Streptomyces sp. MB09-01]MDX3536202.1 DUF4913 domain-containing protein [Streptomyces sp. MB09-01]
MDSSAIEHAQRVAAQVTAEAGGDEWKKHHHMTLTFFLAGARSAHEEEQRARQLDDWREQLLSSLAADAYAEVAELQEQLLGWILAELRQRESALDSLLRAYSPPKPAREPRSLFPMPASEVHGDGAAFYFSDVFDFVTGYLASTIRRPLDGTSATWCPRWWDHPEAGARLASLWLAWEHLRHDPWLGMTTWWIQHADPHLRVLMDPQQGPFAACSPEGHTQTPFEPLPVDPYDPS